MNNSGLCTRVRHAHAVTKLPRGSSTSEHLTISQPLNLKFSHFAELAVFPTSSVSMEYTPWTLSVMLGDDDSDPKHPKEKCDGKDLVRPQGDKSLQVQLVLSLVLGLSAFLIFCVRP